MKKHTREACSRLATQLLQKPEQSFPAACTTVGASQHTFYRHVREVSPLVFLQTWGGTLATKERIEKALRGALRMHHDRAKQRERKMERKLQSSAAPVTVVNTEQVRTPTLGVHQCQWVVHPEGPQFYCTAPVTRLYCEIHDRIAQQAERERFLEANAEPVRQRKM